MNEKGIKYIAIAIVVLAVLGLAYLVYTKMSGNANTNKKTLQDLVNEATVNEVYYAQALIDDIKGNIGEKLKLEGAEYLLAYSDAQLAWAAVYYQEQTGRSLKQDLKDLSYFGWSTFSRVDNDIIFRLEQIGVK
jgi:uncharacterized membrane protein YukC